MLKRIVHLLLFVFYLFLGVYTYAQKIVLPIEVLGAQGSIEERSLTLSTEQLAKADKLWLEVNNLGYENKVSIKINNAAWVDLNHNSVAIQSPQIESGGMAPYSISKNGTHVLTTHSRKFSIEVNHGDKITVSSTLDCEGVFTIDVNLSGHFMVYPNPTIDFARVSIPVLELDKVSAILYTSMQQKVSFHFLVFSLIKVFLFSYNRFTFSKNWGVVVKKKLLKNIYLFILFF